MATRTVSHLALCCLIAAIVLTNATSSRAAPAEQISCPPLMTTYPDGHVELRCPDGTLPPTGTPVATATTTPPVTATGTSVPPTATPMASGFTQGIFDDANVHDAASFAAMITDVKARGFTAIMLTNGSFEHNAALLAVSDQMGMDVYLGAPEITTEFCCWGSDLEYARGLAGRFLFWYAGHPSFRGYYLYDEPDTDYHDMAATLAQALKEVDPGLSRFIVATSIDARLNVYDPAQMSPFVLDAYPFSTGTAHCDIVSPQGRFAGFNYGQFIDEALARSGRPAATPFWMIGQTHGGADFGLRAPDAEEVRAQYRVAREHGASGMFWFVYTSQQGWTGLHDNPTLMAAVTALAQGQTGGSSCGGSATSIPPSATPPTSTSTLVPTVQSTVVPSSSGVPAVALNYSETVDQFWARHPANSASIGYVSNLGNPGTVVSVNPSTIAAALSGPCQAECTLMLADGDYAPINLIARDNIHFRGVNRNGARLSQVMLANCSGSVTAAVGGTGSYTVLNEGLNNSEPWAIDCFKNRHGNFSFKNLTFDGHGQVMVWEDLDHRVVGAALWSRVMRDVWVEDVTVTGYLDGNAVHDGTIGGNFRVDNLLLRRIKWDTSLVSGPGTYAFFDGCQGCAILDSEMGYTRAGALTFYTNDDATEDLLPQDGVWSDNELRLANYIVMRGNHFWGDTNASLMTVQGRNALIENNVADAPTADFYRIDTRRPFNHPAGLYVYKSMGHRIRNNQINNAFGYARVDMPDNCSDDAPQLTPDQCLQAGDIEVTGNHMTNKGRMLDQSGIVWTFGGNTNASISAGWPSNFPKHPPIVISGNN